MRVEVFGGFRLSAREEAAGVLVFPSVVKAGIGLGGEYGEGLLIIRGRPGGYYNLISGSFGFQLGVQTRTVIIMFMTERALASFEGTYGWKVGVDGSVAIVTLGAGGAIGYKHVAGMKPDGYSLVWNSNSISTTYHSGQIDFDYHAFDAVARVLVESPVVAVRADESVPVPPTVYSDIPPG